MGKLRTSALGTLRLTGAIARALQSFAASADSIDPILQANGRMHTMQAKPHVKQGEGKQHCTTPGQEQY